MSIRISCDSTCDLSPEYIREHAITVLPLTVSMGGRDYVDGRDISPDDIFRHVDAGGALPKTAAVNVDAYRKQFRALLAECDAVIHFNISSDFSSCHENAVAAAQGLPVTCVDSRNLSSGIALLVCEAVDMIDAGCDDPAAILQRVNGLIDKVDASFIVDRLDYLYKGGRCSAVAMLGANLLKLKPCIEVVDGRMIVGRKFRGSLDRCVRQYVEDRLHDPDILSAKRCAIVHTNLSSDQIGIIRTIVESNKHFDEIMEVRAGSTICSHCGENTMGLILMRK